MFVVLTLLQRAFSAILSSLASKLGSKAYAIILVRNEQRSRGKLIRPTKTSLLELQVGG